MRDRRKFIVEIGDFVIVDPVLEKSEDFGGSETYVHMLSLSFDEEVPTVKRSMEIWGGITDETLVNCERLWLTFTNDSDLDHYIVSGSCEC